jgi:hypothetical protein
VVHNHGIVQPFATPLRDTELAHFSQNDQWKSKRMDMTSRKLVPKGELKELWEMSFILNANSSIKEWELVPHIKT